MENYKNLTVEELEEIIADMGDEYAYGILLLCGPDYFDADYDTYKAYSKRLGGAIE
jgi:hypothetical protein